MHNKIRLFFLFFCLSFLTFCNNSDRKSEQDENIKKNLNSSMKNKAKMKKEAIDSVLNDEKLLNHLWESAHKSAHATYKRMKLHDAEINKLPYDQKAKKLFSLMRSKDPDFYIYAFSRLGAMGKKVVPELIKTLSPSNSLLLRKNGARALAFIGKDACESLPLLKKLALIKKENTRLIVNQAIKKMNCKKRKAK
jgi:hypothetical protein